MTAFAGFDKRFQTILKDCEARADDRQLPQQLRPNGTSGRPQKVCRGFTVCSTSEGQDMRGSLHLLHASSSWRPLEGLCSPYALALHLAAGRWPCPRWSGPSRLTALQRCTIHHALLDPASVSSACSHKDLLMCPDVTVLRFAPFAAHADLKMLHMLACNTSPECQALMKNAQDSIRGHCRGPAVQNFPRLPP